MTTLPTIRNNNVPDASLAPGGGQSHEDVTVFNGSNQELVGTVAGLQHGIDLLISLGEITPKVFE
eukprot:12934370-Prorocentrum_lima.AAC.1